MGRVPQRSHVPTQRYHFVTHRDDQKCRRRYFASFSRSWVVSVRWSDRFSRLRTRPRYLLAKILRLSTSGTLSLAGCRLVGLAVSALMPPSFPARRAVRRTRAVVRSPTCLGRHSQVGDLSHGCCRIPHRHIAGEVGGRRWSGAAIAARIPGIPDAVKTGQLARFAVRILRLGLMFQRPTIRHRGWPSRSKVGHLALLWPGERRPSHSHRLQHRERQFGAARASIRATSSGARRKSKTSKSARG